MAEFTGIVNLVSNVGFPIIIAIYLLHRFEKKLDILVDNIQTLSMVIEKNINKNTLKK